MVRRKITRKTKKSVSNMNCDPEMYKKIMRHKTMCLGSFLILLGAFPIMGYRWEYVAILFGVIMMLKGIFMKKCC